jgi:hypothetical protein
MTANSLLRQFFDRIGHDNLGVPWDNLRERDIHAVVDALAGLPRTKYDRIEAILHSVFDLACESGINAILEAGASSGDDALAKEMPRDAGAYSQAMWAWLNRHEIFERASLIHQVDDLTWWRKRTDLPHTSPRHEPDAYRELERCLSELLQREQGRGQVCTVEPFHRNGTDFFVAHPDDFVDNVTVHDDEGKLSPRSLRRTFTIVFAFRAEDGSLELFARVPAKLRPRIEEIFAKTMLGVELGDWKPDAYELNQLKYRSFTLATDPDDCVRVHIRRLRLAVKNSRRRLTVEADPGKAAEDIYDMMDEVLNKERLPLSAVNVTMATLCFEFLPIDGRKAGSMSFDVAYPYTCNLRNHRPERVEMATKYLKRWGIDAAGRIAKPMAAVG